MRENAPGRFVRLVKLARHANGPVQSGPSALADAVQASKRLSRDVLLGAKVEAESPYRHGKMRNGSAAIPGNSVPQYIGIPWARMKGIHFRSVFLFHFVILRRLIHLVRRETRHEKRK